MKKEYFNKSAELQIDAPNSINSKQTRISLNEVHKFFDEIEVFDVDFSKVVPEIQSILTSRQYEVFTFMMEGWETAMIAKNLKLSKSRVNEIKRRIKTLLLKKYPNREAIPVVETGVIRSYREGILGTRTKPKHNSDQVTYQVSVRKFNRKLCGACGQFIEEKDDLCLTCLKNGR
jgi:regulatory LuxR family protein